MLIASAGFVQHQKKHELASEDISFHFISFQFISEVNITVEERLANDEVALSPEFLDQYPDFAGTAWYYFDQDLLDEAIYLGQEINSDNDPA